MANETKKSKEEILRLNQELSILNAISQAVNQSIDLDEILNKSLDRMMELTGVRSAGIYLVDEKNNELVFAAHRGFSKGFSKGIKRLKSGEGATGKVAISGEAIYIEDYLSYRDAIPLAIEEGLKSLAVIPLRSRERVYGTLNIARKEFSRISPFEKNLFNSVGQIISGALERASLYSENVKRLQEQRTLYAINQEIVSQLESRVILQKIMGSVVDLLDVEVGSIALWNDRKQKYVIAIVHGLPDSLIGREFFPSEKGIESEVIGKRAPVLYSDYEHHQNRLKELDPYHFKEVMGAPLVVREKGIGIMVVGTSDPKRHFRQNEIDLLLTFAHQAAMAIGNAQLYEDSLGKIRQLTTLYDIGKTLSSTLDLDDLLKKALDLLKSQWGYALCGILLLDQEKDELYVKQVLGRRLEGAKGMRFRAGIDGIVGWVAKTGEPYYSPDVSKEPRYIPGSPEGKSEAAFPLKVRDQVIGVLDIESGELNGFGEEDLKVLSSFASQVSVSIENARLFSDLKQTLQELKLAQDQIIQAEKLRAMGEMASGVAHDFNNVLAVILGNIQLLLHQLERLNPEEIGGQLRVIERAAKDGAETVRRIQEFTGVRRDREFTSVSLNNVVEEVLSITQPRWKDQAQKMGLQIELIRELRDVPTVLGNPSELREVLTNILFNAIDAMPEGGKITISTRPQGSRWVEMKVADTGIGMAEEVKRRVFDPFFTTKGVTSSGLGMSVSYGIVRRHGGEILVESRPGEGTTFVLHLPVGHGVKEHQEKVSEPEKEKRSARILVIDDEEPVRDVLSRMLKTKGHEVVVASNGEEGIDRFKDGKFDLVLTDLGMPKISGWEVGKTIKGMDPKVPVAMITGWGMELNREKMAESGIDLIVSKPFDFDQVIRLISDAMELIEKM
jgi:signal transduction histidine kinase/CheY-like chemotaxis protein